MPHRRLARGALALALPLAQPPNLPLSLTPTPTPTPTPNPTLTLILTLILTLTLTLTLTPPLPLPRTLTKVACAAESTLEALMHSLTPASRRALDAQPASCLGGKRRIPRRSSPLGGPPTP